MKNGWIKQGTIKVYRKYPPWTFFYDPNGKLIADPDHSDEEDRFILMGLSRAEETGIAYQNLMNMCLSDCAIHSKKLQISWK